jgi:hypothetical protein
MFCEPINDAGRDIRRHPRSRQGLAQANSFFGTLEHPAPIGRSLSQSFCANRYGKQHRHAS